MLTTLTGVGVGAIIGRLRERAYWRREAVRVFTRPTLTELHAPNWFRKARPDPSIRDQSP